MAGKDDMDKGGSKRLEGVLTLDLVALPEGTKLKLIDGRIAEVVDNPRDGMWVLLRFLDTPGDPSMAGEEELVFWADIVSVLP